MGAQTGVEKELFLNDVIAEKVHLPLKKDKVPGFPCFGESAASLRVRMRVVVKIASYETMA